jgi:hypothetical protein
MYIEKKTYKYILEIWNTQSILSNLKYLKNQPFEIDEAYSTTTSMSKCAIKVGWL